MAGIAEIPRAFAPGLAAALAARSDVEVEPPSQGALLKGRFQGQKILVRENGTIEFTRKPAAVTLLTQEIRGILPKSPGRFLLGIDEAGTDGRGKPHVGFVLLSADSRAELITSGVRDSKKMTLAARKSAGEKVRELSMVTQVRPVPDLKPGEGYPQKCAETVAEGLLELYDEGALNEKIYIHIDAMDQQTLQAKLGELYETLVSRLRIMPKSEEHPEVAAASVLASLAAEQHDPPKTQRTQEASRFMIRPARQEHGDEVLAEVEKLQLSYPDINAWIGRMGDTAKLWERIQAGKYRCNVALMGDAVVGILIGQEKGTRNAKISTLSVVPKFQAKQIGARLLRKELDWLRAKGMRRTIITFGHEQLDRMQPFLAKYGFTVDGISPQRYRNDGYEVIMGKRFDYRTIVADQFRELVEHDVFRMTGFQVDPIDDSSFLATPRQRLYTMLPPGKKDRYLVHVTTSREPETLVTEVAESAERHKADPVMASLYGWPADTSLPNNLHVLDALALESMFYPVRLERPSDTDLIIPIRSQFLPRIIPEEAQTTLLPYRQGLRTDNVYYKDRKGTKGLRRGARLFFYETSDKSRLVGVGRLLQVDIGRPKTLYARYGGQGAWSRQEIEEHVQGEEAAVLKFDWYETFKRKVPLDEIRPFVPKFNPITTFRIGYGQGENLAKAGGLR